MSDSFLSAVKLLESYRGRDKIMRAASFTACMGSGLVKNQETSEKLMKIMAEISACRTILRLFDDMSMLGMTIKYGLGKHEKDIVDRVLSLLSNIVNQLFFPIEHIAWAADKGLLSVTAAPWWLASLLTWITSLLINIFRGLWKLLKLRYELAEILAKKPSDSSDAKLLKRTQRKEFLSLVESASNLGMAIHWLPGGYLWSGKLSNTTVGALGIVSSVIGLIKLTTLK